MDRTNIKYRATPAADITGLTISMNHRKWTTFLLCAYGFWKGVLPSVHFLTDYLVGPPANLTLVEVYSRVYPIWTYSYLCLLLVVLFLADIVRYKPVIICESLAMIVTYVVLTWGWGLGLMQLTQVTYGLATACEVGYYSYIYAKVKVEEYKSITSFTRCSVLLGKFISGVLAQTLLSSYAISLRQLVYISLASVCICFLIAVVLPAIQANEHSQKPVPESANPEESCPAIGTRHDPTRNQEGAAKKRSLMEVMKSVAMDYKCNVSVLKWSVWWAMASSGAFMVGNYIQPLWNEIQPSKSNDVDVYNGAVDAVKTILGAATTFSMQFVRVDFNRCGEGILIVASAFQATMLVVMSTTASIWICYIFFILYRVLYDMLITVASFQIAKNIQKDTYGMVFGINTFVSLILQTIITVFLVDGIWIAAKPKAQFLVYGCYHAFVAFVFISTMVFTCVMKCRFCVSTRSSNTQTF